MGDSNSSNSGGGGAETLVRVNGHRSTLQLGSLVEEALPVYPVSLSLGKDEDKSDGSGTDRGDNAERRATARALLRRGSILGYGKEEKEKEKEKGKGKDKEKRGSEKARFATWEASPPVFEQFLDSRLGVNVSGREADGEKELEMLLHFFKSCLYKLWREVHHDSGSGSTSERSERDNKGKKEKDSKRGRSKKDLYAPLASVSAWDQAVDAAYDHIYAHVGGESSGSAAKGYEGYDSDGSQALLMQVSTFRDMSSKRVPFLYTFVVCFHVGVVQ